MWLLLLTYFLLCFISLMTLALLNIFWGILPLCTLSVWSVHIDNIWENMGHPFIHEVVNNRNRSVTVNSCLFFWPSPFILFYKLSDIVSRLLDFSSPNHIAELFIEIGRLIKFCSHEAFLSTIIERKWIIKQ